MTPYKAWFHAFNPFSFLYFENFHNPLFCQFLGQNPLFSTQLCYWFFVKMNAKNSVHLFIIWPKRQSLFLLDLIFFLKFSSFSLWIIKKLCTFALNYNYRRMSKLGTIIHPQRLGNKAQGCCAARRNTSFFDTFNVEHWEHSNNLLTHIRRTGRLSSHIFVYVCAREALRHIHLEKGCHKVPLPFAHARFPTSIS